MTLAIQKLLGSSSLLLTMIFVLLGASSRFTNGKYTPQYYAYQEYHRPDDGSTEARIIPLVDTVLGFMLSMRRTRFIAAIIVNLFMILGLVVQILAGKTLSGDIAMVVVSAGAVLHAWST